MAEGMLTFLDCSEVEAWLASQNRIWNDWRPKELEYQGWRPREGADIFNAIQINEQFRANEAGQFLTLGSRGDYLVKGDNSVLYVVSKDQFEQDFQLL